MKRFVGEPHDIVADCGSCGVTPGYVAFFTGIEEETLYAFARGEVALSAHDRLAVMELLLMLDTIVPLRRRAKGRIAWTQRAREALSTLRAEAQDEWNASMEK